MAYSSSRLKIYPQIKSSTNHVRAAQVKESISSSSFQKDQCAYREKLPDTAQLLYDVLKDAQVLQNLLQHFGGHTLRIPARWPPHGETQNTTKHPLRQVLSPEHMQSLVRHFSGTELYIPKCNKYLCQVRNVAIVSSFSAATRQGISSGQAVQELARRYQLSDRRIWGILKSTECE